MQKILPILVISSLFAFACEDDKKPTPSAPDSNPPPNTGNATNGCAVTTNEQEQQQQQQQTQTSTDPNTTTVTTSLSLADDPSLITYESHIKAILDAKCVSCHGANAPQLGNYDSISANLYKIKDVIIKTAAADKHSSVSLTSDEISKAQAWAENGYPRGTPASTPTDPGASSTSYNPNQTSSSNCPIGTSTQTIEPQSNVDDLVNSEEKRKCDAEGKIIDRSKKACLEGSSLDMSWCTSADSVSKVFQNKANAGAAVKAELEKWLTKGWELDQCGMEGTKVVVTLLERVPADVKINTQIIRSAN